MTSFKTLLLTSTAFILACAGDPVVVTETATDVEAETSAIMELVAAESKAFWDKDFDAYAACWAHTPYVRTVGWWEAGGVTVVEGWDARANRTRSHMEQSPEANPTATRVRRENINLRISDDMAWMTFDQYGEDTGDTLMDMAGRSRETRIFEKTDGAWKIVYLGWMLE